MIRGTQRGQQGAGSRFIAGFTLIEMLVAMLIMGLFIGLVGAIARPDDRTRLRVEADRLAQLLELAALQSRTSGKRIAWVSDGAGYQFRLFNDDSGWTDVGGDDVLRTRALPDGMLVAGLQVENMRTQDAMRLEFSPYGQPPSFGVELALGKERYSVEGTPVGEVRVLSDTERPHGGVALH